ncbi:putative serine/arginine rich splicing factor [Schistosoma mansoni]|uniref:putative serine/arginine rich splicing factor n=3 Tax=Schistosoma mansoni TaxID=6183 RepID=UPI0001A63483|nr:putative serine/arginine rich splicing factor [Schistosoma mansoni]|eukprot:XP_018655468.1 putative serine/arginine rich splicing factor [Schistosoma mansoni]
MPRRSSSLYIRHLPDTCRHDDLRRCFGRYGRIVDVTIPLDFFTGRMKGYAFIEFENPRDAEDAHYYMDHTRFMGRDIEVEFTRGYRKTPAEMRLKERRDEPHRCGRKYRSRSRSRSYSNSRQKGVEPYYRGRPNDRRDDSRRRINNVRPNRSASRSRSPTRSRSASHDGMDNGDEVRKGSRRNDRRDNRAVSRSPAHRRGSLSRSRSGSY